MGKIVNYSGQTVVSVASNEFTLTKNLSNPQSLRASKLLGHVLALRALESGIHSVFCDYDLNKESSLKVR